MSAVKPPEKARPKSNEWPRWTEDDSGDQIRKVSVPLGLAVTVLIHLGALGLFLSLDFGIIEKEIKTNPPLEVEFLPPPTVLPEFVQTNPAVPEEVPEDTDKISSQDQVAAQEIPIPMEDSDTPTVEGEMLDAQNIVSGDLTSESAPPSLDFSEAAPEVPPSPNQEQAQDTQAPPEEQPPEEQATETEMAAEQTVMAEETQYLDQETAQTDPGLDKVEATEVEEAPTEVEGFMAAVETGDAEVMVEETVEETAQPERGDSDRLEVYMEEVAVSQADSAQPSTEPRPQARPRLNFIQATSGPLKREQRSANRVGAIAVDAKFDKFGAYLQRMIEAVDLQWQLMARQSSTIMAEMGSRVVVRYTINQQGEITNMEVLFSSASRSGMSMCVEAIQSRAPFGVWTKEMMQILGDDEDITFTFYYR